MLLIIIISFIYILTGCSSDSKQIDDQVYPVSMGIDNGVDNRFRITIQFPTYKESSGGGGSASGMKKSTDNTESNETDNTGNVDGTVIETIEGPSVLEAINLLNTSTSRRVSLIHLKEVVFSEALARDGLKRPMSPLTRFMEMRRSMYVIICRGNAENFIRNNITPVGQSLPKSLELMAYQSTNTGYFPHSLLFDFYRGLLSPYEDAYAAYGGLNDFTHLKPLPEGLPSVYSKPQYEVLPGDTPRKGNTKRELIGTAVFNGDKMVGSLNSNETRYFLMVIGKFQRSSFTFEDKNSPGDAIVFDLRLGRAPKINVTYENGIPVIYVKLNIEADISVIESRIPYEKIDRIGELNNMIKSNTQDNVKKIIEKTQKEWHTDIFKFGYHAAKHFFTIQEFERYNWLKHYSDAKVNVTVEANVRRTGMLTEASSIRYSNESMLSSEEK